MNRGCPIPPRLLVHLRRWKNLKLTGKKAGFFRWPKRWSA
jgi:hypothetical protein